MEGPTRSGDKLPDEDGRTAKFCKKKKRVGEGALPDFFLVSLRRTGLATVWSSFFGLATNSLNVGNNIVTLRVLPFPFRHDSCSLLLFESTPPNR